MSVRLLAFLSLCLSVWTVFGHGAYGCSRAHAQSEKILVVRGSDVPEKLEEDVTEALDKVGSVMSSSGYTGNLRARRQEPDSEEALTKLAPQMGATLIVVLGVSKNKLEVAFRNGHTGRVIDEETVPARGKRPKLGGPARKKIANAAKRAMSKVGPAPAPAAAERSYPQETVAKAPSKPSPPVRPTPTRTLAPSKPVRPPPQPEPEEEEEEEAEGSAEESAGGGEEAAANAAKPSGDEGIAFLLNLGGGFGSRSILVPSSPTRGGGNQIDTSFAPLLDVSLGLEFAFGDVLLRVGGAYRTIFGMSAAYNSLTGAPAESSLSSHSVIVGASLGYLTNGPNSLGLHLFVGWAYRGLSASEPLLPSASIQGPAFRPELHIPVADGFVTFRIAPELILILNASTELPQNVDGLESVGLAFGGEVSIDFKISSAVGLGVQFRESRGSVASGWGTSMVENERYISARLTLRL